MLLRLAKVLEVDLIIPTLGMDPIVSIRKRENTTQNIIHSFTTQKTDHLWIFPNLELTLR